MYDCIRIKNYNEKKEYRIVSINPGIYYYRKGVILELIELGII
jgi:hypothetical protein